MRSFLLVILLAGVAQGQQQPTSSSIMDFSGGLNTLAAPIYLPPSESPDLMNVVIDEPLGALVQRNGYLLCGRVPSGNTATNLYEYNKNDGSRSLIVTDSSGIWSTQDCINYTVIESNLNTLFLPRFETIQDKLWVVNGSTWTFTWDGTTRTYLDGTGTKPNVPKGRYIRSWKNRVWIASPVTDPSAVSFNSLTSSTGAIIAPDASTQAWSTLNTIYFGRDDGSQVYGIYPFKDNLLVFKERAIWRLLWDSEFNLNIVKSVSSIGSKFNDSIVELDDGSLRYAGVDGIYSYDGQVPTRVSTKITPNYYALKQPNRGERSQAWDSAADFLKGTLFQTTTAYLNGSIALDYYGTGNVLYDDFKYNNYTTDPIWTIDATSNQGFTVPGRLQLDGSLSSNAILYSTVPTCSPYGEWKAQVTGSMYGYNSNWTNPGIYWYFIANKWDHASASGYKVGIAGGYRGLSMSLYRMDAGADTLIANTACAGISCTTDSCYLYGELKIERTKAGAFTVTHPMCTTLTVTDSSYSFTSGNQIYQAVGNGNYGGSQQSSIDDIYLPIGFKTPGRWTSDISTATGLAQWGVFDAESTNNGQSIAYEIRTASTVYNLNNTAWREITPGAAVSTGTTDIYAQIKSSLTTSNIGITPTMDRVSLSWITGDITKSPIRGVLYKSRYWLAGSTIAANLYNDVLFVESRPPLKSYTTYDMPLSAMVKWNNNLYGAISNTDKIVRLDYGTNDDGAAIRSWWTSKDEVYQNPIRYKNVNKAIVDYLGITGSLSISLSPNEGATSQSRALSIVSGPRATKILNFDANQSQAFRVKITNSALDSTYKIYGIHTLGNVTDFIGN